jgi:hypothetical protein
MTAVRPAVTVNHFKVKGVEEVNCLVVKQPAYKSRKATAAIGIPLQERACKGITDVNNICAG